MEDYKIEKNKKKDAEWGIWILAFITVVIAIFAYNYDIIGEKLSKVLEVVGSPFPLALGFYVFQKTDELLHEKE